MTIFNQITYADVVQVFGGVTLFIIFCYFLKLGIHIVVINDQIEKLFQLRDKEIHKETSGEGLTTAIAERRREHITKKYDEKINPLLRKKGYIFDILPFIPKK